MDSAIAIPTPDPLLRRPFCKGWLQAFGLVAGWGVLDAGFRAVHSPLPTSIAGLLLLWLMLEIRLIPAAWLEDGANRLLDHLMLFFVPAMLALVDHRELVSLLGLKLLAAVLTGTLVVMAGTALFVEIAFHFHTKRHAPRD